MKLYDPIDLEGYSTTHPRGWKEYFLSPYYESIKNRKYSKFRSTRDKRYRLIPTYNNKTTLEITIAKFKNRYPRDVIRLSVMLTTYRGSNLGEQNIGYHSDYRSWHYMVRHMKIKL